MCIALLSMNKICFVDGSSKREAVPSNLQPLQDHCNAIVISWIFNILSKELSVGIVFASNASCVWKDLQERFDKVDASRICFLHCEIVTHNQGTASIPIYFTKLLKLLLGKKGCLVTFFHL